MSTVVAGVDFGTLSVRVSIFDSEKGRLGSGSAEYPLHRKKSDPDYATQSHDDHMQALASATRRALTDAGVRGDQVAAIALDTTGSSVRSRGRRTCSARRILSLVRPPRLARSRRDHG